MSAPDADGALAAGRYRLTERIGAGGMAIVWRARDARLDRDVAVKMLADNLCADPGARERFEREARAVARLSSPDVVPVFDVGEEDGRPFLVMEHVAGPSLARLLDDEGPLRPEHLQEIARAALRALEHAHAAGVLHRDLKPGNLLVDTDGRIRITDFGVAQTLDAPGLTATGHVVGTRGYLAPEQRHGTPASERSDLYALGVTLAQLATGEAPTMTEPPDVPPDLPPVLRRLVATLLAEDPDARPASATAALELLDGGSGDTARLPVEPATGRADGHARRRAPRRLRLATGVGVVALGVALAGAVMNPGPETDRPADAEPPAPSGDPAADARELAAWLRELGDG